MLRDRIADQLALLPSYLSQHLMLSLLALIVGTSISVPLGVMCMRRPRTGGVILGVAGFVQTVPSLALLALMVPLLGMIGFWPAFIALVLYSMLPILRNTVTGLAGIDRAMIEAANAMGMTPSQRLFDVELPLAAPTIIAGIRTAAVWVIGIATLATPVGQTTLGNFIFAGLQTQNHIAVMVGCISAAVLAVAVDSIIRLLEVGSGRANSGALFAGLASLAALFIVGMIPLGRSVIAGTSGESPRTIFVGSKTFTEQYVLAEAIGLHLRDEGYTVHAQSGLGSQIAFDALANNSIDVYVDYSGTIWTNVGSSRVDLQACKLEYSIVSPK